MAGTQIVVLDFNQAVYPLIAGSEFMYAPDLREDGFTLESLQTGAPDAYDFGSIRIPGNFWYNGPNIPHLAYGGPAVLTNDAGSLFSVKSLDIDKTASFFNNAVLQMTGFKLGGGIVTFDFTPDHAQGFQTITLPTTFSDLYEFRFSTALTGTDPHSFDNIVIGLTIPSPFTSGSETVNLNAFDLTAFAASPTDVTNALGGDDVVALSNTQNIGVLFNAGEGDDNVTGSSSGDLVSGGGGKDTVSGGDGDDTFIIVAADVVSGDTIDGGADSDTLRVDGGGTVNLTLLSLSNVEHITLTDAAGTNVTVTAAQAALITAASGTTDIVTITGNTPTNPSLVLQLINAGVEQVNWSNTQSGSAEAFVDPSDAMQFIIRSTDTDLTRPFDYIRTTFDASGSRVAQTQLFDTGLSNGVLQQQAYNPATGGLISNAYIDTLGTRTFQSITTDFTDGVRTHSRTINDNATLTNADDTIVDQYYDAAGVISLELTTDASPGGMGKPWVSVAREYVGGVTQIFRTTYDNGNQQVVGTAGTQEVEGGGGNDVLIGGAGADAFVFAPGFGNDTVHDYLDGTDRFDFTAFSVDTRAELEAIASITAAGTATLIDFGGGNMVKILKLAPAALGDSDFILV